MKEIKLFELLERSFIALKKSSKKMWIIGIIISIFSGALIIDDGIGEDFASNIMYNNAGIDVNSEGLLEDEVLEELIADGTIGLFEQSIGFFIGVIGIFMLIFIVVFTIMSILIYIADYYLCHSTFEALFDTSKERASLGLVVKVNILVGLKVIGGLILFIIPGIVLGIKYAPVNYVLCKNPNLSSKEILSKTRELSNGFKWKIFLYNLFLLIISSIIVSLCTPTSFINGSSIISILIMIISLALNTFTYVYTSIFDVYLYKDIEDYKDTISVR